MRQNRNNKIASLFVKLKFIDFSQTTVEKKNPLPDLQLFNTLIEQAVKRKELHIRLIGIGVRFIENMQSPQLEFNLDFYT